MPFDQTRDIPIGHQRLNILADFLDKLSPEQFNISTYWCGTQGCALGWATTIPEFRDAGFHMAIISGTCFPAYITKAGLDSGMEFFQIGYAENIALFASGTHNPEDITPAQVATNIRKLLMVKQHAY